MIHLKDINKTYQGAQPLHVLKGISLDIGKGELVSIMGASGSGKSTLLNILGILDNYDSGTYELNGTLIWNLSESKAAEYRNRRPRKRQKCRKDNVEAVLPRYFRIRKRGRKRNRDNTYGKSQKYARSVPP